VGRGGREKEAEERAVASETERKGGTPGSVLPAPFVSATRVRMGARRLLRERRSPQRTNRLAIPAAASATLYLRVVLVVRFADQEWRPRRNAATAATFRSAVAIPIASPPREAGCLTFAFEIRDIALSSHLAPESDRRVQMGSPVRRNDNLPSAFLDGANSPRPSALPFLPSPAASVCLSARGTGGALKLRRRRLPRL